jgi:hypothetical protein
MCHHQPSNTCDCLNGSPAKASERPPHDGTAPVRTTGATGQEWSERAVDPGDSHDKGALSLCVGEAA